MAKSRKIPNATVVVPPVAKAAHSSSEEDSDESDSAQPTPVPSVTKAAVGDSSSSEEDSDESESEPETKSKQVKKKSEKPSFPAFTGAANTKTSAPAGLKRPSTVTLALEASSVKRSKGEGGKGAFVRVFSNEDEIILLKGLEGLGLAPSKEEIDQYIESMMGKLSDSVTKAQISDKLRRLKNKFFSNREKAANNNEKSFSEDAHESAAYNISEKIWGTEKGPKPRGGGGGNEKKGKKGSKPRGGGGGKEKGSKLKGVEIAQKSVMKDDVVEKEGNVNYVAGGKSTKEWAYAEGMELLDEDAKMELQSEWKQLIKEELGFMARSLEQKHAFKARKIELKRKHLDMLSNAL